MLRRLIEYVLFRLQVIEGRETKDAFTTLLDLLPCMIGVVVVIGAIKSLGLEVKVPWHKRLWYRVRCTCRRGRFALIGW